MQIWHNAKLPGCCDRWRRCASTSLRTLPVCDGRRSSGGTCEVWVRAEAAAPPSLRNCCRASWGECTSSAAENGDCYHPDPDVFACVDDYLSGLLGSYADSRTYDTAEELLREAISEAFAQDAEDAHNQ